MRRWRFGSFQCPQGGDELRRWFDAQVPSVQAEFVNIVQYLRDQPGDAWERPDYADLVKKQRLIGFGEIRIKIEVDGLMEHHRILGFRDDVAMRFTVLAAEKKSKRFDYDEVGLIEKRKRALAQPEQYVRQADWIFE